MSGMFERSGIGRVLERLLTHKMCTIDSHFVRPETALDAEASRRCTSTYLVTRVIPMLPPLLSEELCSLNPGVDRFAFSCVWVMNEDGEMEPDEPRFHKSIIRSCSKLDYPTAQRMIEGLIPADAESDDIAAELWDPRRRPACGYSTRDVTGDVLALHRIAAARRVRRFESGALRLNRVKLSFELDADRNPIGFREYPIKDSNKLVEEYMLLANYLVAEKLIMKAGPRAILRRHPPALPDKVYRVVDGLHAAGLDFFSWTSAGDLQSSLEHCERISPSLASAVTSICTGPNKPAGMFAKDLRCVIGCTHFGHV